MPDVCDLSFPPPQKPGMVPPPPGEESQSVVLPPGWQSYLSPQGRRYYVNTTTNGESRSGVACASPGLLSLREPGFLLPPPPPGFYFLQKLT